MTKEEIRREIYERETWIKAMNYLPVYRTLPRESKNYVDRQTRYNQAYIHELKSLLLTVRS